MREGKLPDPGTVCQIESRFFDGPIPVNSFKREDTEIADAWRALASSFRVPRFGSYVYW